MNGKDISCEKIKNELKVARKVMGQGKIRSEKWQEKLLTAIEEDEGLDSKACFTCCRSGMSALLTQ